MHELVPEGLRKLTDSVAGVERHDCCLRDLIHSLSGRCDELAGLGSWLV